MAIFIPFIARFNLLQNNNKRAIFLKFFWLDLKLKSKRYFAT